MRYEMEPINWLDKGADWLFWIATAAVALAYNWLNGKTNKLDDRMALIEKQRLEDKLENLKTFVDKDDLFKVETKVDKVFNSLEELKSYILTKP